MKKKEILIVFVLAVLVTGLSWLVYFPAVVMPMGWGFRGLPIPFWDDHSGTSLFILMIDLLFWFLVIFAVWKIIRKLGAKT